MTPGQGKCRKCGKPTLYGKHAGECVKCPSCERIGLTGACPHVKDQVDVEGNRYSMAYDGTREYYDEIEVWGLS